MNGQVEPNGQANMDWEIAEKVALDDAFKGTGFARSWTYWNGRARFQAVKGRTVLTIERAMVTKTPYVNVTIRIGAKNCMTANLFDVMYFRFCRRRGEFPGAEIADVRVFQFPDVKEVAVEVNDVTFYMK